MKSIENQATGTTESEVINDLSMKTGLTLVAGDLSSQEDILECISCKSLQDLVSNFSSTLNATNLGSQSSALAFIRLLGKMRESSKNDIKNVLQSNKKSEILPQLLDVVASTQTAASHKAALGFLKFQETGMITLPQRYLLTLSMSTHPTVEPIQDFFDMAKRGVPNDQLQETLLYTVASLVRTYSRMAGNDNKQIVVEVTDYFHQQLELCKSLPCTLLHVFALKTLQQKSSIPILFNVVRTAEKKSAIQAMRAIQTMPSEFIDTQVLKTAEEIYLNLDRPHNSSVRIMAANMVMQYNPSEEFVRTLLSKLRDQTNKEFSTLLLSLLRDHCDNGNKKLIKVFRQLLKSPEYSNYDVLAQNGLSSAFSRPLSAGDANTANSSFSSVIEMEEKILTRSTVDVFVDSDDNRMRLLSFGIFSGGLSHVFENLFVTGGNEGGVEAPNAGIELTLMDTSLPPFVFFTNQVEMIMHVWSQTASVRTTALQGLALMQDHSQRVSLQNGFSVEMLLTGAVSYDFAGQINLHYWESAAHSVVEIGAGVVIQGRARVDTSFVQTMIEFNAGLQSKIDFVTDVNYEKGVKMCIQMVRPQLLYQFCPYPEMRSQPDYEVVENVRKLERISGSNYVLRKYKKKTLQGSGKTYVLNKKNTQICNKMLKY